MTALRAPRAVPATRAALTAAGCATTESANDRISPEMPMWFNRPGNVMTLTVRRALTAGGRTVGEDYERGRAEIDPVHDRVFIGSADRGLYALRAGDGSTVWRFETLGVVQSEPLYDAEHDTVYFGSNDGALYAVRAFDGSLLWRFFTGAEVARRPVLSGEMLYFANAADQLFAVDRRTGKQHWRAHRTPALGMEIAGYAGPSLANGVLFMAYSDGHVAAYDARDGSEKWAPVDLSAEAEQSVAGVPRYLDVDTTPVPDELAGVGKGVYVASYAGGGHALDAETGSRIWANDQARGVTDLTLWSEPAHRPSEDGPDRGGRSCRRGRSSWRPAAPRASGASIRQRPDALAQRRARGRDHGADPGRRRRVGGDDALRVVFDLAVERSLHRRDRLRLGLRGDAGGVRPARLRDDQRGDLHRPPDLAAGGVPEPVAPELRRVLKRGAGDGGGRPGTPISSGIRVREFRIRCIMSTNPTAPTPRRATACRSPRTRAGAPRASRRRRARGAPGRCPGSSWRSSPRG